MTRRKPPREDAPRRKPPRAAAPAPRRYEPFLRRLSTQLRTLTGWQRWLAAFLSGTITASTFAPTNFWFMLFTSVPVIIWLLDGTYGGPLKPALRAAAAIGWWFGFGQFVVGLYWIHNALMVEPETYGWLAPIVVVAVPAGLALFGAAACVAARLAWRQGAGRILIFAVAWSLAEWLRGHILSGFPWNLTGYAWNAVPPMLQTTAFVGIYGLGLVTLLLTGAVAAIGDGPLGRPRVWLPLSAAGIVLSVLWVGGGVRLKTAEVTPVPDVRLRIVQPNIDQRAKWDEAGLRAILARLLQLSASPGINNVTQVIWPETAVPFYLDENPAVLHAFSLVIPPQGGLITGTIRRARGGGPGHEDETRYFNAVQVVGGDARVHATYDKTHLVPFGEYMPLKRVLAALGLDQIIPGPSDFSAGTGERTLDVPGAPPFEPLICYEAIFPGLVAEGAQRARWIVNVTNDAWFGSSAGPHQHLAQARVRAIEQGLPLVRAANTGISAVIDPYGRIHSQLALGESGVLDSALPQPIDPPPYARFGDQFYWLMLLLAATAGLWPVRRQA